MTSPVSLQGGLPYWLFTKYPEIKVRTYDENYLAEVRTWYAILFEKVTPYLYGQGGNIIMVQVENEYGVFEACDHKYMEWVRDETKKYVNDDAVLFTVDIPNERFGCGVVEGVFATTDFGAERGKTLIHTGDFIQIIKWVTLIDIPISR